MRSDEISKLPKQIRSTNDNISESKINNYYAINSSKLIEFYLTNTKDLDNKELNNLIITNASLGSKLENK